MKAVYLLLTLLQLVLTQSIDVGEVIPFGFNRLARVSERLATIGMGSEETELSLLASIFDKSTLSLLSIENISSAVTETLEKNLIMFHRTHSGNLSLDSLRIEASIIDKLQKQHMIRNAEAIDELTADLGRSKNVFQRVVVHLSNVLCYNYLRYNRWRLNNIRLRGGLLAGPPHQRQEIREVYHIYMRMQTMTLTMRRMLVKVHEVGITGFMDTMLIPRAGFECTVNEMLSCYKKRRRKEVCTPKGNQCLDSMFEIAFTGLLATVPIIILYNTCVMVGGWLCVVGVYLFPVMLHQYISSVFLYELLQEIKKDCLKWLFDK